MLNRNTKQTFILATSFAASALVLSGCRSMPGAGLFGMRGEPSVEALAGSGPTVTYPAPPSALATPEAIASVAGGTAKPASKRSTTPDTAQVAGFDVSPGYTAQATNMAAAQANGIYSGGSVTKPATFNAPASATTKPSSYAFGAKAITPKSEVAASTPTSYSIPGAAAIASPTAPITTPSTTNSFTPPPLDSTAMSRAVPSPTQGFTLPTDSPSFSAITPPTVPTGSTTNPATAIASILPPTTSTTGDAGPAAAAGPSFSTASAATGYTAPSNTSVLPATLDVGGGSVEGYMPGSTGTNSGYPTSGIKPTTSGSYYR